MRHLKKKKTRYRQTQGRQKAVLRNLATSLVLYEKVETTKAKAKSIQPIVEKFITLSKKNNLTVRRRLLSFFRTKPAVDKLLEIIGPKYANRKGGYTRIIKTRTRQGDAAEMVQISLVK